MASMMGDGGSMTDSQMMSLAMQMQNQQRADAAAKLQAQKYQDYLNRTAAASERQAAASELAAKRELRAQDSAEFTQQKAQHEADVAAQKNNNTYIKDSTDNISPEVVSNGYVQENLSRNQALGVTTPQNNALLQMANTLVTDHKLTPAAAYEAATTLAKLGIPIDKAMTRWDGGLLGSFEGSANANLLDGIATHNGLAIQDLHHRDVVDAGGRALPNASADYIYAKSIGAINNGDAASVDAKDKAQKQAALTSLASLEKQYALQYSNAGSANGRQDIPIVQAINGIKQSLGTSETDQKKYQLAQTLNPQQAAEARLFGMAEGNADTANLLKFFAGKGYSADQLMEMVPQLNKLGINAIQR
jgi:hypothetical protein